MLGITDIKHAKKSDWSSLVVHSKEKLYPPIKNVYEPALGDAGISAYMSFDLSGV